MCTYFSSHLNKKQHVYVYLCIDWKSNIPKYYTNNSDTFTIQLIERKLCFNSVMNRYIF